MLLVRVYYHSNRKELGNLAIRTYKRAAFNYQIHITSWGSLKGLKPKLMYSYSFSQFSFFPHPPFPVKVDNDDCWGTEARGQKIHALGKGLEFLTVGGKAEKKAGLCFSKPISLHLPSCSLSYISLLFGNVWSFPISDTSELYLPIDWKILCLARPMQSPLSLMKPHLN